MIIEQGKKLDFCDVLIKPRQGGLASRRYVDIERTLEMKYTSCKWRGVPIIASNMASVGTVEMAIAMDKHKMLTALHKFQDMGSDELADFLAKYRSAILTVGMGDESFNFLIDVNNAFRQRKINRPMFICLDIANGHIKDFLYYISRVRENIPYSIIMAGNVCTPETAEQIVSYGADIVKLGIGGGSVCKTREVTGVGYPQFSAIIEAAHAVHGVGGFVASDGGVKVYGDYAKAFGAGADLVMAGSIFAGHDECGQFGEIIDKDGELFGEFYGMSSEKAQLRHYGERRHYRSSEGADVLVPYKGPVDETLNDICRGLRSACTYVGAEKLEMMHKKTTFIVVNRQSNDKYDKQNT